MSELQIRAFTDRSGVAWTVRKVQPERVERRTADRRRSIGEGGSVVAERRALPDRRVTPQLRVRLPAEYAQGWLLLESSTGERRRVAPVPSNWAALSETALSLLVRVIAIGPGSMEDE
jgi:hypothetical protein